MGSSEAQRVIVRLEKELRDLKRAFELYFAGVERRPPIEDFEKLKKSFAGLVGRGFATAQVRFRVENLLSRWQTYRAKWERDLAKMEVGKFKRGIGAAPGRGVEESRARKARGASKQPPAPRRATGPTRQAPPASKPQRAAPPRPAPPAKPAPPARPVALAPRPAPPKPSPRPGGAARRPRGTNRR
jgi:hypothetical protein